MEKLINFNLDIVNIALKRLLEDKSTKKNIIWGTHTYEYRGASYSDRNNISLEIFKAGFTLEPRIIKSGETQLERTRKKAEVFTPSWVVNKMINYIDEDWFRTPFVFNREETNSWNVVSQKITFPKGKTWRDYVLLKVLEITCGEAPFLVSRYDTSTGELIHEVSNRIGILDRKLRVVNENTKTKEEWITWAIKAVQSCYGYEYQGDNLLIARINMLLTVVEHFKYRWTEELEKKIVLKIANIISWNIWQMDGLKDTIPYGAKDENFQVSLFTSYEDQIKEQISIKIYDWRANKSFDFKEYKENKMKKFDYVIGNPPYQEDNKNRNRSDALYNSFMDFSYEISDKVLLITPARFLFNVGSTSRAWNEKMLNDKHFKVLKYEQNSEKVFSNTDIKGGIVISYRNKQVDYGPIKTFTAFSELNSILRKVEQIENEENLGIGDMLFVQNKFDIKNLENYNKDLIKKLGSSGKERRLISSIFDTLNEVFSDNVKNEEEYFRIIGRQKGQRVYKWIRRDLIEDNGNLHAYKVILPSANGSGAIGEVLSTPLIGEPLIGYTQTFISIGNFKTLLEAQNCMKYIKSKFMRTMLGIKKVTQNNKSEETWSKIPKQNFTEDSDIDWSKSIKEIDKQLYEKYGLSQEEIDFIEEKVQEMK